MYSVDRVAQRTFLRHRPMVNPTTAFGPSSIINSSVNSQLLATWQIRPQISSPFPSPALPFSGSSN
jgi:hypothetical protein